jgi:hypothetical protein
MRQLTTAQVDVLENKFQSSYWTMIAVFAGAGVVSSVAGTALSIDGVVYESGLISTSGVKSSLGSSVDRIDITVQNADWRWTKLNRQQHSALNRVYVGRAFQPVRDGAWAHITLLSGIIVGIPSNESTATIQCISDLYAAPNVGALRQVAKSCQWKYKDPRTCGYTGPEPTCNKIFESPDGCLGRNNQHRYGGWLYQIDKDTLYIPAPDPNANPDPGGGAIGGNGNIYNKYDNPYMLSY